jgi:hypothetical protein
MNLIKEYLGSVEGADVFAIISMLIFLILFLFMIYHTYSLRKDDIKEYKKLPLEDSDNDLNGNN